MDFEFYPELLRGSKEDILYDFIPNPAFSYRITSFNLTEIAKIN